MRYGLVIFDLDGTLLDTLDDLAAAANHALALRGLPPRSRDEVRRFIGNGVANLIRRALPEGTDEAECRSALADFSAYYASHLNVHTKPFGGIVELLEELRRRGVRTAVNSNKPDSAVAALCQAQLPGLLDMALGETAGIPRKPAPDGAQRVMQALDVPEARTLYVGDGDTDLITAQNAGIDCAWVAWGYRTREELGDLAVPHAFETVEALRRFLLE